MIPLILLLGFITYWLYRSTRKPEKFPPGPPKLPLVGGLFHFIKRKSLLHSMRALVDKYGKVSGVYFGNQPAVIIADYNILKDLMKKAETSFRPPIRPLNRARPGWETLHGENKHQAPGVIASNGNYWTEQRRFLLKNLRDFGFGKASMESIIQEEVQKLCNKLGEISSDEATDLKGTFNISVLNSLWSILVGERLELEDEKLKTIIRLFDQLLRENDGPVNPIVNILPDPYMATWPGLSYIFGFDQGKKIFTMVYEFIKTYVDDHKKSLDVENIRDFTDLMLVEIDKTKDENSSFFGKTGEFALFNDLIDLFVAGMETTSSSLLWTFLYLIHHPDVQEKVHEEIDDIVGRARPPSLDDRPKLHYTNAVLQESFRITGLVSGSVPHMSTEDVAINEDFVIPKGAIIFGSLYLIMNDPSSFKNPRTFSPERFLNSDGKFNSDERVIPFGTGKRQCLGQTLAEKQFFLFFAGFMQRFRLIQAPGTELPTYDVDGTNPRSILRSIPQFSVNIITRMK